MENYVIGICVAVAVLGSVAVLIKRSGRKGCCSSGSDYKPRPKRLKKVIATKVFVVDGMHCEKCSNRVTEIINDFPDAAGVVDLKKGTVTVSYRQEIPDEQILKRLQRAGYPARRLP